MMDTYPQQCEPELTANQALSPELIASAQSGDDRAIVDVYSGALRVVKQVIRRLERNPDTAEDLIYGALERVLVQGVYHRKFQEQEGKDFAGWAATVTRNYAASAYRKGNRGPQFETLEDNSTVYRAELRYCTPSAEDSVVANEAIDRIQALFSRAAISDKFVQAFIMRHVHQMSGQHIADELEIPVGTVRSRVHRAGEQLKDYYHITNGTSPSTLFAALTADYTEAV